MTHMNIIRGFYESKYPEHPYPEVTAFQENDDGTVTLTVHAVSPISEFQSARSMR